MSFDIEVSSDLSLSDGRPLPYINASGLPDNILIQPDGADNTGLRQIASQLSRWVDNARNAMGRSTMFDRGVYAAPDNPYDEMRAAKHAVKYDEIVGGVAEVTEAYAFQGVMWESSNQDEADVFNQLSRDMNLDDVVRKMWRDEYTCGQFVAAKVWGWYECVVRGKTSKGNQRKKRYKIWAPLQIRTIDPLKTVPVGVGPLAGEVLCWQATMNEINDFSSAFDGRRVDPMMTQFFTGHYQPNSTEAGMLAQFGIDPYRLLSMNPEFVFRHTITKQDYDRWPDVRLKSVFRLLDLKQQLLSSDRAMLIGAANYILLVRKGSDQRPAQQPEIENLQSNFNYIAKMPVIISDHRLEIDIIAPKTDMTLAAEKYDTIDQRLLTRLLGTLSISSRGQRNETQDTLSDAVARVMQNRRHMLRRTLELEVARAVVNHPRNRGIFDTEPNLVYVPRNIALAMSQSYAQGLLTLRTQRELSRETVLEYFGLDEATEAMRMEMEAEFYDDVFKTQIPFNGQPPPGAQPPGGGAPPQAPQADPSKAPPGNPPVSDNSTSRGGNKGPNGTPEAPGVSGARGGRPPGGGSTSASPQRQQKPRTRKGNPRTASASEEES